MTQHVNKTIMMELLWSYASAALQCCRHGNRDTVVMGNEHHLHTNDLCIHGHRMMIIRNDN
jgi:hypothetical protein